MDNFRSKLNCLQSCVYSISKKHNLADPLIFPATWNFLFDRDAPISSSLKFPLNDAHNSFLAEYEGMSTEVKLNDSTNGSSVIDSVIECIHNGMYVLACISSFDCPWHRGYGELNVPHYISLVDVSNDEKVFICEDPYFGLINQKMPFAHFCKYCKKVHFISVGNNKKPIDVKFVLREICRLTSIDQITQDMIRFSSSIHSVKTKEELFDNDVDLYFCSNTRTLKFIADSRYCLSYLFSYLNSISTLNMNLNDIANSFLKSHNEFNKINNFYMMLFYNDTGFQRKLNKIRDRMLYIVDIENGIHSELVAKVV